MEYIIILILFAAVIFFAGKYYGLKRQLKSIVKQLSTEHVRLVTIALADDDMESVVLEINRLLEQMQQIIIRSNASSDTLKSSIADISHDMKTPLTSVIGYLQLALRECGEGRMREMIVICLERARYCNALINDFFELSVIESQGCCPEMKEIDAAGIICEQILANFPIFEERGITPHFSDMDRKVMVSADFNMLNRVIQNLISNGIKYTSGDIYFCIRQEDGQAVVTISNPVNADVDVSHIFDRFYTQDKSRSGGSGIGLYVCRQFVEAMGGRISAEIMEKSLSVKLVLNNSVIKD